MTDIAELRRLCERYGISPTITAMTRVWDVAPELLDRLEQHIEYGVQLEQIRDNQGGEILELKDRLEQLEAENARLIDQNTENGLMAYEWHVKADREEKRAGQYEKALREIRDSDISCYGDYSKFAHSIAREALAQVDSACDVRSTSSRICERGTRCCVTRHTSAKEEKGE